MRLPRWACEPLRACASDSSRLDKRVARSGTRLGSARNRLSTSDWANLRDSPGNRWGGTESHVGLGVSLDPRCGGPEQLALPQQPLRSARAAAPGGSVASHRAVPVGAVPYRGDRSCDYTRSNSLRRPPRQLPSDPPPHRTTRPRVLPHVNPEELAVELVAEVGIGRAALVSCASCRSGRTRPVSPPPSSATPPARSSGRRVCGSDRVRDVSSPWSYDRTVRRRQAGRTPTPRRPSPARRSAVQNHETPVPEQVRSACTSRLERSRRRRDRALIDRMMLASAPSSCPATSGSRRAG